MDADMAALLGSLTCVNGTVYERICEVYQYVCSNVTYDNVHSSSYSLKYSAYAALHNRTAVCQGYAVLLYRILLELGIDVRVIGGFGYSEPHAWNIIRIGDYYYNVDATWDSASSSGAYQCFLKCRATFKNHSRDAEYETDEFLREYPVNSKDYSSYSCVSGGQHTRSSSRRSVPATCTKNGYAASYYCSVCGQGLEMAKIIPATGHHFGSWKTVKAATVFDTGYRKHTCSSCGEVEYEYQEKLKSKAGLNVTGTLPMKVGQSTKKVKIVSKANGDYVSSWSSSKPSVVFVSRTGKLKARRKGKATITVKMAGGAKASFKVKVTRKKVKTKSISLPSKALTLKKGKTFSLKAVLTPLTSQQKLKYKSSNKKVVKVSSKGKLTALRRGTAVITVRSGSKKIRCTVKVA